MKKRILLLLLLASIGCSSGVIVHDQTRAAELVVDFLGSLNSESGVRLAWEWTDDQYKAQTSFEQFTRFVYRIREQNLGADVRLTSYEVFGAKPSIVIHAKSETGSGEMHFRFLLVGTKVRDYYLLDLSIADSEFDRTGLHREFAEAIIVEGV